MAEVKTLAPIDEMKGSVVRMEPEFAKVLPSHVSADKFVRTVITALQTSPKLVEAIRSTFYKACMDAATDGLLPDGREGAIIPYKGKAKWMPMVQGIMKKVRNSGEIGDIDAQIVCENDEYDSWIDEKGRHFKWRKAKKDRGAEMLTFAYAVGKDGTFYFEEIGEEDMRNIEKSSPSDDSPWKGPFKNEMKRKSALRRLAKYRLPSSTDLTNLTQTEDDIYEPPERVVVPDNGQPNRLKSMIGAPTETTAAPEIEFPDPKDVPL